MNEREAFNAQQDARHELTSHPRRPVRHADGIWTYLAGFLYRTRRHDAAAARRVTREGTRDRPVR